MSGLRQSGGRLRSRTPMKIVRADPMCATASPNSISFLSSVFDLLEPPIWGSSDSLRSCCSASFCSKLGSCCFRGLGHVSVLLTLGWRGRHGDDPGDRRNEE
jgi:hypothetical protein